jgi:hypothetical protein
MMERNAARIIAFALGFALALPALAGTSPVKTGWK